MNAWKLAPVALAATLAVPSLAAAGEGCDQHAKHDGAAVVKVAQNTATKPAAAKKGERVIEIVVNEDGFVPADVKAKAGETVKLVVTRKVERTCATEIVMKDLGVNQPLPLGKAVTVTVKPAKAGDYRFACGMDMIAGTLHVE